MHLEDLLASADVGQRHDHLPVEAAGSQQCRIQHVGPVGRRDDDHALVALEAVHLDQQLIERLLALVVAAAEAGSAVTPDGIDLIDEDDAGRVLLRLVEHVADARSAHADEHLDEIGARDREERHLGFAGDRAREQGLPGPGGPDHQHAARNLAAQPLELGGILEEIDDLADFLLRLVDTRDVGEGDRHLVLVQEPRPALAEGHGAASTGPALHLAHEIHPDADQQQDGERRDEELHQERLALRRGGAEGDAMLLQGADEQRVVGLRVEDHELFAAAADAVDLVARKGDLRHGAVLDVLEERRIRHLLDGRSARAEIADDRREYDGDHYPEDDILREIVQILDLKTRARTSGAGPANSLGRHYTNRYPRARTYNSGLRPLDAFGLRSFTVLKSARRRATSDWNSRP